MNLQQTKFYLDKLQREYNRISKDPDNIIRLDVDMMLEHTRQLYDALLADETTAATKKAAAPARQMTVEAAPPAPAVPAPAPPPTPPTPIVVEVAPPPPPAPAPPPPPPPPAPAPEPVVPHIAVVEKPAHTPKHEPAVQSGEMEVLFEEKQAKELSEKLSSMPIADLKKALPLNDRLLYTKELFAGDAASFDAALTALNACANFAEGKKYLMDHCVIRYGWLDKKRTEHAKDFIKLVRRRLT